MTLSRRALALSLGAVATGVASRGARADMAALEAAARKEGSLTWYVAQVNGPTAEAFGKRFSQRYPGVQVSVIRTTGQVAYERLQQEMKNSAPQCDVFSSTDIAQYLVLHARKALANYTPRNLGDIAPAYQSSIEPGFYFPTTGSLHVLVHHSEKLVQPQAPTKWTDLLDPKYRGKIGIAHPAFSGYFGQWVLAIRLMYGWAYFEKLATNRPRIGRSGNDPITLVNAGECLIGTAPASTALQNIARGNPISIVYPEDGTLLSVGPSAILANAPHPNAARLFLEWLLSAEYAEACAEFYQEPVRADAPPMRGGKRLSEIKTINVSAAEIAKNLPEAVEQWRDTFGN